MRCSFATQSCNLNLLIYVDHTSLRNTTVSDVSAILNIEKLHNFISPSFVELSNYYYNFLHLHTLTSRDRVVVLQSREQQNSSLLYVYFNVEDTVLLTSGH
jgi:hypothetical protein